MPDFWQFPTVSMGLGPMMAIYQARFMRYLEHRGWPEAVRSQGLGFLGDGEMDEPESLGAITLPVREKLDNLIFVINCNLQRLDGPVRGNGKIIQELEGVFRGAGWNVIKVIWGSRWDPLLARDTKGLLRRAWKSASTASTRTSRPRAAPTRASISSASTRAAGDGRHMSDDEIWRLNRGGHDPHKVYAAYKRRSEHKGQPTVILPRPSRASAWAKAGRRPEHRPPAEEADDEDAARVPRPLQHPGHRRQVAKLPFYKPAEDSAEMKYLRERRKALGGYLPQRRRKAKRR
jgi:pyruvate dehydrogenase E1 component